MTWIAKVGRGFAHWLTTVVVVVIVIMLVVDRVVVVVVVDVGAAFVLVTV